MADVKISDLANLAAPDGADLVEAVDVSDTSSAATGTNKKLTLTNFQVWLGGFNYTPSAHAASHEGGADAISPAGIGAATAAQGALADTAVQPDAANLFTVSPQTIQSPTVGGGLDLLAQQTPRIRFLSETGVVDNRDQRITQTNLGYLRFAAHNDAGANVAEMLRIYNQSGITVGDPTGGDQGLGAINAQSGVFDNGNRAYSAGNPPPAAAPAAHAASHNDGGADALAAFGTSTQGVVPASGGGTTNFLRADGTWANPGSGGWVDGTTITDWGDTEQTITGSGAQTLDLDNGHFASGTLTASKTITFQSTANHGNTSWDVILATGGFTPTWAFTGATVNLPDGYDIADNATYWFTFRKVGSQVYVSERKMQ